MNVHRSWGHKKRSQFDADSTAPCPRSAAVGLAALVEGTVTLASAETNAHAPSVLTGNHFDLTIEPHRVNFTGRPVKALKINGPLAGPTLKWREGSFVDGSPTPGDVLVPTEGRGDRSQNCLHDMRIIGNT
jgi:hypothetical protein